ncbi:transcription factor org2 [Quercus suber]|uniref:Transcription factor org2 n=1 Tax=Quercus suber TaxID=58331 RepID=A0AAW0JS86_QUESU
MSNTLNNYFHRETEASAASFAEEGQPPFQTEVELNRSTPSTMAKRLYHNASERDRRKKINTLYSTLRSLLPKADQAEKLSVPDTVSWMLKYIPELEQQVEVLIQKKEELISRISTQGEQIHQENQRTIVGRSSLSAVSANWLNDNEVMIQISIYKVHKSPLADILLNLEKDGFLVLNASSFECFGGRIFHNLHLQVCVMLFVNCFLPSKLKVNG